MLSLGEEMVYFDTSSTEDDDVICDMLFGTNASVQEIAEALGWQVSKVKHRIEKLGLDWVNKRSRKLSRGHASLTAAMQKLLPGCNVVNEHHIGERLMLDIYCPEYKLAIEFHGKQHFEFNNHFYDSYADFLDAQRRDKRKIELCKEQGISLVVFRYCDKLDLDTVYERLMDGIVATPYVAEEKKKRSVKENPVYDRARQENRDYRRREWERAKKYYAAKKRRRKAG